MAIGWPGRLTQCLGIRETQIRVESLLPFSRALVIVGPRVRRASPEEADSGSLFCSCFRSSRVLPLTVVALMKQTKPTITELDMDNLEDVLRRVDANELKAEDGKAIRALAQSYIHLTQLLQDKNTSLARLRKMLFGATTEKTSAVVGSTTDAQTPSSPEADTVTRSQRTPVSRLVPRKPTAKSRRKPTMKSRWKTISKLPPQGHGRNGADESSHRAPRRSRCRTDPLQPGDACSKCKQGTLYDSRPGVLVRLVESASRPSRLRFMNCRSCVATSAASSSRLTRPTELGAEKYDATAGSMIALLKYGSGMPFHRLHGLQENLGIPLPASRPSGTSFTPRPNESSRPSTS